MVEPKNTYVMLDGQKYFVSRQGKDEQGPYIYVRSKRPSQRGDSQQLHQAVWRLDGPCFNSHEHGDRFLGPDYTEDVDTRFHDHALLSPAFTETDLTGSDDVNDDITATDGVAIAYSTNDTFAYWIRGSRTVKQDLSDWTIEETFQHNSGNAQATSIIATTAENGEHAVSIALDNQPYRVITPIADAGSSDTEAENADAVNIRIFGQGDDRVFGLGGNGNERKIVGNILTGTVDMLDGNWEEISEVSGGLTGPAGIGAFFTGFGMDKRTPILGTVIGPYGLNSRFGRFEPLLTGLSKDEDHCRNMLQWFAPVDLSIPLKGSVRRQLFGESASWGLEVFHHNESPVKGYVTAQDGNTQWLRQALYQEVNDDTWIIDWRPTRADDHLPQYTMQPFTIRKFTDKKVRVIKWIDTLNGVLTNPHWIQGHGTSMARQLAGRTEYMGAEFEDANYVHVTSGKWYGTDMRRFEDMICDFESVEMYTEDCDADQTITVGFSTNSGSSYTDLDGTYTSGVKTNGKIITDGYHRVLFVDNSNVPLSTASGRTFKPRLTFATDTSAASPKAQGHLRLNYYARPHEVDVFSYQVNIENRQYQKLRELRDSILGDKSAGPVLFKDMDDVSFYVRVVDVQIEPGPTPDTYRATITQIATETT